MTNSKYKKISYFYLFLVDQLLQEIDNKTTTQLCYFVKLFYLCIEKLLQRAQS